MNTDPSLTPEEEQAYLAGLRDADQEATIRSHIHIPDGVEASEGLTDVFVQNIMDFERMAETRQDAPPVTVGSLLPGYTFRDPERLTNERAQRAIDELFAAMTEAGMHIDQPKMMLPRDFYRWCRDVLMNHELDMPPFGGWNVGMIFSELEPLSEDAMRDVLEWTFGDLFESDGRIPVGFNSELASENYLTGECSGSAVDYISAWRAAFTKVESYGFYPQYAEYLTEDKQTARFHFELDATLVRENGQRENISCEGTALMKTPGVYWGIEGLHFKGFSVGDE